MENDELIEPEFDDLDEVDGNDYCDGCGNDGPCPLCCGGSYAPGSEECDFCKHSDECMMNGIK